MTIVRCPRCRDEVTIPPKAPLAALVRCPLCLDEYLLSEAVSHLPPTLVLVMPQPEESGVPTGSLGTGDWEESSPEHDYKLADGVGGIALKSWPRDSTTAPPLPTTLSALRAAPRPRRKEKNPLAEAVKIVGGGVVGLALGLLLLWWGLGRDPLEVGPKVAKYAPWIVPANLRSLSASAQAALVKPNQQTAPGRTSAKQSPLASEDVEATLRGGGKATPKAAEPVADAPVGSTAQFPPMPDLRDLLPDSPTQRTTPPSPKD